MGISPARHATGTTKENATLGQGAIMIISVLIALSLDILFSLAGNYWPILNVNVVVDLGGLATGIRRGGRMGIMNINNTVNLMQIFRNN